MKTIFTLFSVDSFEQKFITVGEALTDEIESHEDDSLATAPNESLYDVPRSNRRVTPTKLLSQLSNEAIYVNDDYVGMNESTYDVPR